MKLFLRSKDRQNNHGWLMRNLWWCLKVGSTWSREGAQPKVVAKEKWLNDKSEEIEELDKRQLTLQLHKETKNLCGINKKWFLKSLVCTFAVKMENCTFAVDVFFQICIFAGVCYICCRLHICWHLHICWLYTGAEISCPNIFSIARISNGFAWIQGGPKNGQPKWPKFDKIYRYHVIE